MNNYRLWIFRLFIGLILGGLLFWALKNAPLGEIWNTINRLKPVQIGVLIAINICLYILISFRWWLIVRAQTPGIPFWPLVFVRIAVFGVSYFTLGPQIGGEPLQVLALKRRYGITYSRATASVLMDKLMEFLVNFLLLAVGIVAILQVGLLETNDLRIKGSLAFMIILIFWPIIHIGFLYKGIYPLTALIRLIPIFSGKSSFFRFIRVSEWLAGNFCRRHPRSLLGALLVSLTAGFGLLFEYAVMVVFLGINLPVWSVVAGWTAGWLSFLIPLPGGLGALEASQVFILGVFHVSAASAISVTLLMRARDLLIGGLGLLLAGDGFSRIK